MIKLSEKEVKDILKTWFELKPKLPNSISLSLNISNMNDRSDDVILYNTELHITIHSWNTSEYLNIPKNFKELLKIYDKDYCLKPLQKYL